MHLAIFCVFLPFGLATTLKQLPPTDEFDTAGAAPIKASYIVEMKSEFDSVESILSSVGDSSADKYLDAFNGFVASLTDNQLKMLQANPKVKHIEANTRFQIEFSEMSKVAHKQSTFGDVVSIKQNPPSSQTMQWGYKSFIPWTKETKMYKKKESLLFEKDAEWNLARISHRKPKRTSYVYDKSAGSGTCVYVIDSGIDTSHPLFEGRAKFVKSFLRDSKLSYKDYPQKDMFGHGTHVAGIIGSSTFGVAKNTTLYSLKVTDKNGGGEA
ncbi:hypothetical protein QQS21_012536 [Conoideocrella luteorostrata]|uniref:Uncharacterized protein n=1 Tax=Conoideocrella luteorostrata TaxID=1105319 RepID=A0AAJ0FUR4_9HYPO|nr:hypothetical protein QQS21_012536 [Conoideocrella luteorostrata]